MRWKILLIGLFVSGAAPADPPMGRIGGQPLNAGDLTLKEQIHLYQEATRLERLWRQYAERYAFDRILADRAKEAGADPNDYLQAKAFADLPEISEEQVDRYLGQNPQLRQRFRGDPQVLRLRARQALLAQEKDQRLAALRQAWFVESDVQFDPLFGGIAAPRIQVPTTGADQSLGPATASLDVVVFLDLECPYSRRMFPALLSLQSGRSDEVRLVFKHLPLPIHEHAVQWAVGAECAGKQGRFVEFAKEVYSRSAVGRSPAEVAAQVGLDAATFDACLADEAIRAKVAADQALARELGITDTPTIVIGDSPVVGQASPAELQAIVNGKLAAVPGGRSPKD